MERIDIIKLFDLVWEKVCLYQQFFLFIFFIKNKEMNHTVLVILNADCPES